MGEIHGSTASSSGLTFAQIPSFPLGSIVCTVDPRTTPGFGSWGTANHAKASRIIIPKAGTLKGFSVYIGGTTSGNIEGFVTDTNATTRNVLWSSGSVAMGTINTWQTIGDPNITVTLGQQVDFAITIDNTTGQIARSASISGVHTLPAAFTIQAPGGGKNQITWDAAQTIPIGSTIAEAGFGGTSIVPLLIAYIA